jgi:hypothetical protein
MTGGIARRPKRVAAPAPAPGPVVEVEEPVGEPPVPPVDEPPDDEYEGADEPRIEYDYDLEAEEVVEAEIVELEPVPAPPEVTRIVRHPDLDDDDPEEHFVTDDDASPGATSDDVRRPAD